MSLCQPFSGDRTTDERQATKDVKTIQLLNTLYTASQWMEVLEMESVALKLATQYSVQKPALAALICTILGETHLVTNGFAKAIVLDERGLELYEGNGDIRGQMITLYRLGSCHRSLGNYKKAIVRFKNVRKIYVNYTASPVRKPLGEDFMEVVLASLGKCYTNVGQNHKAIETHKRCRKLAEARKDSGRLAVAKSCENLGQAYSETGQFNTALDLFQQANLIAKEENCHGLPDEQVQMRNIGHVGLMLFALGQYRTAILQFELAMQQAVSIGSKQDQGFYCTNLGCCYSKAGDHAKAITLQEQNLQIFNALKDRTRLGQVHSHLATCLEASGEYGLAIKAHLEARTVAKEVGNQAGESVILGALGSCHTALGNYSQAIACHQEQFSIAKEMSEDVVGVMGSCYLETAWSENINLHLEVVKALLDLGVSTWSGARHKLHDATANNSVTEKLQAAKIHPHQQAYPPDTGMYCTVAACLLEALDLAKTQGYFFEGEHAQLYLAFLAFDADFKEKALGHLRGYLETIADRAYEFCRGCWQKRGKDASMRTCAGCSVVKFCDKHHQKMASHRGGRCRTRITIPHKDICALLSKWRQVDKGHASVDSYTADMLQFLGTYNLFWTPTPENMKLDSQQD